MRKELYRALSFVFFCQEKREPSVDKHYKDQTLIPSTTLEKQAESSLLKGGRFQRES